MIKLWSLLIFSRIPTSNVPRPSLGTGTFYPCRWPQRAAVPSSSICSRFGHNQPAAPRRRNRTARGKTRTRTTGTRWRCRSPRPKTGPWPWAADWPRAIPVRSSTLGTGATSTGRFEVPSSSTLRRAAEVYRPASASLFFRFPSPSICPVSRSSCRPAFRSGCRPVSRPLSLCAPLLLRHRHRSHSHRSVLWSIRYYCTKLPIYRSQLGLGFQCTSNLLGKGTLMMYRTFS